MSHTILTIPGPWAEPPELPIAPNACVELMFGPPQPEMVDDFADISRISGALTNTELKGLRLRAKGVIYAKITCERTGDLKPATAAAKLMLNAFEVGAMAVLVETAGKAFAPGALKGLSPRDANSLFHLLVEVMGDGTHIDTEGMQSFNLPDVRVAYDASSREAAQQAALGMAARMVCGGFRPLDGAGFRAVEGSRRFACTFEPAPSVPEGEVREVFENPAGRWCLRPAEKELR